jgi:hypothetical protein
MNPGNTKGGSITVPLTSCLTGLDWSVLQIKTKIVSCHTGDSKPVKQEVNGTVVLPSLVFPDESVMNVKIVQKISYGWHVCDKKPTYVRSLMVYMFHKYVPFFNNVFGYVSKIKIVQKMSYHRFLWQLYNLSYGHHVSLISLIF